MAVPAVDWGAAGLQQEQDSACSLQAVESSPDLSLPLAHSEQTKSNPWACRISSLLLADIFLHPAAGIELKEADLVAGTESSHQLLWPVLQLVNKLCFHLHLKREKILISLVRQRLQFLAAIIQINRNLIYLLLVIYVPGEQGHGK